jgi:hypothetical protein
MRVINRPNVDKEDVRHMTDSEVSELGVHVVNRTKLILGCNQCGETWEPPLDASGRLPFGYWVCPAKCNE